ncbi:MAG: two-component regulator propeller domain-containing protein [bacterium]
MQTYTLLFLMIFISSCKKQDTQLPKQNIPKQKQPALTQPSSEEVKDTNLAFAPRSITRSVMQDKNGNIWLATWEGIIRYDGKRFTNLTLEKNLSGFNVFSLLEVSNGDLWFGTIGGGVYKYDGKSFELFTTKEGLAGNSIFCIMQDNAGFIWFGTENGISRFDGKSFTNFTTREGLGNNFVSTIIQDKTGKVWAGTNSGVSIYDPSASTPADGKNFTNFMNKENISFQNVRSLLEDKTGNIWIASQTGLSRYDGKTLTKFPTHLTNFIFEDKTGNLWLSEGQVNSPDMVLTKYDGNTFTEITKDRQVFGITQDKSGNIWFGIANGVKRYDGSSITKFTQG